MNQEIESTLNQLPDKAQEAAQQAADTARTTLATAREKAGVALQSAREKTNEVLHNANDALHVARDRAGEAYGVARERTNQALHVAKDRTNQALAQSSQYVRQNPIPTLLGALAVGIAVGVIIGRREEQRTFRQRLADDPVHTAREAIYSVLSPIAEKLHDQYDVARSGARHAVDRINTRQNRRAVENIFDQARRTANQLKFW